MSTKNVQARLLFDGGWATDFGPTAQVALDQSGVIRIPYLVDAENCVYDLDGGPRKIGGTEKINSSALNSGTTVRGLVDFWKLGTSSSVTQHRVVHVGDELMKDDGDGSFSSIAPSVNDRNTSSVPSYATYDDDLIIFSDALAEVPLKWDGLTAKASALGTNTPNCAFGVMHKNRFFMAGDLTKKSRVYFSEPLPNGADGDWNQVEAGFFDVDPNDDDEVRGFASHKGILWIFKGPYKGSIHTLRGDTPLGGVTTFGTSTQPVPFKLDNFIRGVGAAGQNSIFRFRDDIGFIDAKTASIRSLNATDKFGDFREAALSFPINDFLLERVNKTRLKNAWATQDVARGSVLITLPLGSDTTNGTVLNMDYRFDSPRWSQWPAVKAECLASVIDTGRGSVQSSFIGDTAGFMSRTGTPNYHTETTTDLGADEETAINYKVTLPHLDFGNPVAMKTFARAGVGIAPTGSFNGTFGWARDDHAQQTTTFSQGGGDVLAGSTTDFTITLVINFGGAARFLIGAGGFTGSVGDTVTISDTDSYNGVYTITLVPSDALFEVGLSFVDSDGGMAQLTSTSNFFALGTSTLAGSRFVDRFFPLEEGGEFRSVQIQLLQAGLDENIEVHSLFAELEMGADSMEND